MQEENELSGDSDDEGLRRRHDSAASLDHDDVDTPVTEDNAVHNASIAKEPLSYQQSGSDALAGGL